MDNNGKIEKAKEQIVKYRSQLQNYGGDNDIQKLISVVKVIKELDKIMECLK